jgi:hypothetical protein
MKKKNKIERRIYKEKIRILGVDWADFKGDAEMRIKEYAALGFSGPLIKHDEYEIWLEMTKVEDDESYNKRLADSEKSEQIRIAQRIEKLKKEAKELGLEIK